MSAVKGPSPLFALAGGVHSWWGWSQALAYCSGASSLLYRIECTAPHWRVAPQRLLSRPPGTQGGGGHHTRIGAEPVKRCSMVGVGRVSADRLVCVPMFAENLPYDIVQGRRAMPCRLVQLFAWNKTRPCLWPLQMTTQPDT